MSFIEKRPLEEVNWEVIVFKVEQSSQFKARNMLRVHFVVTPCPLNVTRTIACSNSPIDPPQRSRNFKDMCVYSVGMYCKKISSSFNTNINTVQESVLGVCKKTLIYKGFFVVAVVFGGLGGGAGGAGFVEGGEKRSLERVSEVLP